MYVSSLPWCAVQNYLVEREVAPLPASSCCFIKDRFGVGLGDVRVYAGPAASRLCDILQARALVLNRDLVFGGGQHLLHTVAGQRLLVHEIVHLIQSQQHQGKPQPSQSLLVGDPQSPYELEADRIADDVMNGRVRTAPTPDMSGAIRRSFTVLPNATMEATYTGATPGVSYVWRSSEPFAVLHLTRNSAAIVSDSARKLSDISAIRITANIPVLTDTRENLADSDLRFRFVQFFALRDKRAYYAGPSSGDGNMYLDFARKPAFSGEDELMLDTEPKSNIFPYFEMYPPHYRRIGPSLWNVTIAMDDHPFSDLPLRLSNFYTKKINFLCTASKAFNVVTALVVRDYTDASQPKTTLLGQMLWGAELGFSLRWTKGADHTVVPNPAEYNTRTFYCKDARMGFDADLTSMIEGLTSSTETINDSSNAAVQTVLSSNHVNRNVRVFEKWTSNQVQKFFP
jgi:Domain of unknown function (DUF4157)